MHLKAECTYVVGQSVSELWLSCGLIMGSVQCIQPVGVVLCITRACRAYCAISTTFVHVYMCIQTCSLILVNHTVYHSLILTYLLLYLFVLFYLFVVRYLSSLYLCIKADVFVIQLTDVIIHTDTVSCSVIHQWRTNHQANGFSLEPANIRGSSGFFNDPPKSKAVYMFVPNA